MLDIVLEGACAHLEIWYTNGITSVCPWYQEQPRNMQEEDSVPQTVYLGQVWMMGEESQTLCQDNSVLWLSEKPNCFFAYSTKTFCLRTFYCTGTDQKGSRQDKYSLVNFVIRQWV